MWTFQAEAGDSIALSIGKVNADDTIWPWIRLRRPDGTEVGNRYHSSVAQVDHVATNSGTFTVVVGSSTSHSDFTGTGGYRLTLAKTPASFVVPAGDQGGALVNGANHDGTIHLGDLDMWTFQAEAGDSIALSIGKVNADDTIWPWIRLRRPDGTEVGNRYHSSVAQVDHVATNSGTFTVVVGSSTSSSSFTGTGGYRLHFSLSKPPLIFIPGIAGSVLDVGGLDLWPTINPLKLLALDLEEGLPGVLAIDVVRSFEPVPGFPAMEFYGPLIDFLTTQRGFVEFPISGHPGRLTSDFMLTTPFVRKPSLFVFPYDWRRSSADHAATLQQYVAHIRQLHGGAPVRFVAHSMGGFVLRRYLLAYGNTGVDRVMTIGTPYWGAPVATHRVLRGDFYPVFPLNWINNDSFKRSLATFPGFHELLPSQAYFDNGGFPFFSEFGRDLNNNGINREFYTLSQYHALMDNVVRGRGVDQYPSQNSLAFHGYLGGRQDDSAADGGSIKYLQIVGQRLRHDTTVEEIATAETHYSLNEMDQVLRYIERKGPGDGTVPTLSARRLPAFHPPGATTITLTGGVEVGHNEMTQNPAVWELLSRFLAGEQVPSGTLSTSSARRKPHDGGAVTKRLIAILGTGFVKVRNAAGAENTRLSEIAALKVPGAEIRYGGDEPWVEIEAEITTELSIEGIPDGRNIEVEVAGYGDGGELASLRRHRFSPGMHLWRLLLPSGDEPDLKVDTDDSTTFESDEIVLPTHQANSGSIDATSPSISMTLALIGADVSVSFEGDDNSGSEPTLRFQENSNPIQTYASQLKYSTSTSVLLKAFAEDGMGNTSGLIETTINPSLSARPATNGTILVKWHIADGYVLEHSPAPGGAWQLAEASVTRSNLLQSVTIPIGSGSNTVFRLRSQTVTR